MLLRRDALFYRQEPERQPRPSGKSSASRPETLHSSPKQLHWRAPRSAQLLPPLPPIFKWGERVECCCGDSRAASLTQREPLTPPPYRAILCNVSTNSALIGVERWSTSISTCRSSRRAADGIALACWTRPAARPPANSPCPSLTWNWKTSSSASATRGGACGASNLPKHTPPSSSAASSSRRCSAAPSAAPYPQALLRSGGVTPACACVSASPTRPSSATSPGSSSTTGPSIAFCASRRRRRSSVSSSCPTHPVPWP